MTKIVFQILEGNGIKLVELQL